MRKHDVISIAIPISIWIIQSNNTTTDREMIQEFYLFYKWQSVAIHQL